MDTMETNKKDLDIISLFECPVCTDYALPPIMQCQMGHIVCQSCHSKLTSCPSCRGTLNCIRNLAMEKIAAGVFFPCKYQPNGCNEMLSFLKKQQHEEQCEFRPYSCPCPGAVCQWSGPLESVMPHLFSKHKSITTLQGEDIVFLATNINLAGAVDWVMMQSCFGQSFMLVLEKQERTVNTDGCSNVRDGSTLTGASVGGSTGGVGALTTPSYTQQTFYAVVQLIGSRKQAEQFAYRLELNGNNRRLTWEATPRSIHEGVQNAIGNSDCLVFDSNTALHFADNGNLGINVTITQSGNPLLNTSQNAVVFNQNNFATFQVAKVGDL